MALDCPYLDLTPYWAYDAHLRNILVVRAVDGDRLCRSWDFEKVPTWQAIKELRRSSRSLEREISAAGAPPPNLSIVIARLRGRGGVVVGQVQVPSKMESGDQVGAFKVSVQDLRSARGELDPGKYALFTFVGDEAAPVQVFQVE
jgi:hypothetical protein